MLLVKVDAAFTVLYGANEEATIQQLEALDGSVKLEDELGPHSALTSLRRLRRLEQLLASRYVLAGTQGAISTSAHYGRRVMEHAEVI